MRKFIIVCAKDGTWWLFSRPVSPTHSFKHPKSTGKSPSICATPPGKAKLLPVSDMAENHTITQRFRCPRIQGKCPRIQGKCPQLQEKYPRIQGKCPQTQGKYRRIQGKCWWIQGKCSQVQGKCPRIVPKKAKECQRVGKSANECQGVQRLAQSAEECQRVPRSAKKNQSVPRGAKGCQRSAKECQRMAKSPVSEPTTKKKKGPVRALKWTIAPKNYPQKSKWME